jgi:hypothetical protein
VASGVLTSIGALFFAARHQAPSAATSASASRSPC